MWSTVSAEVVRVLNVGLSRLEDAQPILLKMHIIERLLCDGTWQKRICTGGLSGS